MAEIKFIIPDEKLDRIVEAMKGRYKIPKDENGVALFTDTEWVKEAVRRLIVRDVYIYEAKKAIEVAIVEKGDELLS